MSSFSGTLIKEGMILNWKWLKNRNSLWEFLSPSTQPLPKISPNACCSMYFCAKILLLLSALNWNNLGVTALLVSEGEQQSFLWENLCKKYFLLNSHFHHFWIIFELTNVAFVAHLVRQWPFKSMYVGSSLWWGNYFLFTRF